MNCPKCSYTNNAEAKFCNQCATSLIQEPMRSVAPLPEMVKVLPKEDWTYKAGKWWAKIDSKTKRIIFGVGLFVAVFGFIIVLGNLITSNQSTSNQAATSQYESRSTLSSSYKAPNTAPPSQVTTRNQAAINKQLFNLLSDIVASDDGELEKVENVSAARNLIEQQGAEVNARDELGETPLITATRNGHIRVMEILLDHKAEVNAQSNDGKTALIWAAHMGDLNMTKTLLKHGANPMLVDSDGFTARSGATQIDESASTGDPARDRRHKEIMRLLRQAETIQQKVKK
jgi:hypothetical protein